MVHFPLQKVCQTAKWEVKKKGGGVKCLKLDKIIFHVCDLNFFWGGGLMFLPYFFCLIGHREFLDQNSRQVIFLLSNESSMYNF